MKADALNLLNDFSSPVNFIFRERECFGGELNYVPLQGTKATVYHYGLPLSQNLSPANINCLYAVNEHSAITLFNGSLRGTGFTLMHGTPQYIFQHCLIGSDFVRENKSFIKRIYVKFNLWDKFLLPRGYNKRIIGSLPFEIPIIDKYDIQISANESFSPIYKEFDATQYFVGPEECLNEIATFMGRIGTRCIEKNEWFGLKSNEYFSSNLAVECNKVFTVDTLNECLEQIRQLGHLWTIILGQPITPISIIVEISNVVETANGKAKELHQSCALLYPSGAIRPELIESDSSNVDLVKHPLTLPNILGELPGLINLWHKRYPLFKPIIDTILLNYADGNVHQFHFSRICDALKHALQNMEPPSEEPHYEAMLSKFSTNILIEKLAVALDLYERSPVTKIGKRVADYRNGIVHPAKPVNIKNNLFHATLILELILRSYLLIKLGIPRQMVENYQYFAGARILR